MHNEYPRDGETYQSSDKKAKRVPTSPLSNKRGIQEDMVKWFQDAIDFAGSIDNIQIDKVPQGVDRQVHIEAQVLAHKLLRDIFIDKQREFKEFIASK